MNLWFSSLLLVGLSLSASALTTEQCKAIVTPLPTFQPMYGRWTFILGYSDNPVYNDFFRSTRSQWIDFLPTNDPKVILEDVGIRHPTLCKYYATPVTIVGNAGISQKSNFTCHFHSLPTCKGCLLFHTTSLNNNNLLKPTGTPTVKEELTGYRTFYLMATRPTIPPEALAHAKEQAKCLGFVGEPTFHYDYKDAFCHPGIDP